MRIRTQLVIAAFLLSILPLTAIVAYSYYSSRAAVETAYHREGALMTRQMEHRLASIRNDLEQRLAEVSALPLRDLGATSQRAVVGNVMLAMGDAASIVDSLEIQPFQRPVDVRIERANEHPTARIAKTAPPPPAQAELPPGPSEPIVIDMPTPPPVARFEWSNEERRQVQEITKLSTDLSQNPTAMTSEQRDEVKSRLRTMQQTFETSMKSKAAEYEKQVQAAMKAREAREKQRVLRQRTLEVGETFETQPAPAVVPAAPGAGVGAGAPSATPAAALAPAAAALPELRRAYELTPAEKERINAREKQAALLFGHRIFVPLRKEGQVVGQVSAQVSTEEVIKRVLGSAADRDEIAFAVDREGNVYTRSADDQKTLESIGLLARVRERRPVNDIPNWITAFNFDPQSGLRIGVARPVGDTFEELRKTAAKNFGYGMALVFIALIGIVPVANHITRDIKLVTVGAERVAHGDLTTRLPVRSKNEFGQLAGAFNRMAHDLSLQQQTIVQQERQRKDYERKSIEMEEARRFQLSMLPKNVPGIDCYDVAVSTQTATEVGGDYYDFHVAPGRVLSVTVGDATGHGAKAGTMVTVVKTLFSGYSGEISPAAFLRGAAETVKRMELGRMAMALLLARLEGRRMTIASAGMPPAYVHRAATGEVEEIIVAATPLGTLGADYDDVSVELAPGDTVLFMSDGFPELFNAAGQQLGYAAAQQEFATAATAADAKSVIGNLAASAKRWHGEQPPNDDVTFVVVRARAA